MREKTYATDSTKGHSIINPLNYKGDVLVQVWVDSRVLATLCNWLDDKGTYARYMSQVVRRPLEVLVDLLVSSGDARLIDNTVEARSMLQKRFGVDLSRGGRGTKNVMHNITLSISREELAESVQREKRVYDVNRPLRGQLSPKVAALVEEAHRVHKELFSDDTQKVEHFNYKGPEDIIKRDHNEKVVKSEDAAEFVKVARVEREIPLLKERGNSRETIEARIRKADEESQKGLDELNSFDPLSLMATAKKEK